MWHIWETGVVHTGFWLGDLREIDQLENLGLDGTMMMIMIIIIIMIMMMIIITIIIWVFKNWDG